MKPTRQHILLGVLAAVGLANVGDQLLSVAIQQPLADRRARQAALEEAIAAREKLLAETRTAGKAITQWQAQSLPANIELARSQYRSWLHDRVNRAGLSDTAVDSGSPSAVRGLYTRLPFSVRGRGTLSAMTSFLFEFARSGQLHRIESLTINPAGDDLFNLSFGIESLIVPGTKRKNGLSTEESTRLAASDPDEYDLISQRNIFGIGYRDPLSHTVVTAITWRNGQPCVWIAHDPNQPAHRVKPGDEVRFDGFRATVVSATDETVVLERHGRRLVVELGQTLAQSRPLIDSQTAQRQILPDR